LPKRNFRGRPTFLSKNSRRFVTLANKMGPLLGLSKYYTTFRGEGFFPWELNLTFLHFFLFLRINPSEMKKKNPGLM